MRILSVISFVMAASTSFSAMAMSAADCRSLDRNNPYASDACQTYGNPQLVREETVSTVTKGYDINGNPVFVQPPQFKTVEQCLSMNRNSEPSEAEGYCYSLGLKSGQD